MLGPRMPYRPTVFDQKVFETYVPSDHHLRKALELIDWDAFHDLLAPFCSENRGQPSEPPTMMLQPHPDLASPFDLQASTLLATVFNVDACPRTYVRRRSELGSLILIGHSFMSQVNVSSSIGSSKLRWSP